MVGANARPLASAVAANQVPLAWKRVGVAGWLAGPTAEFVVSAALVGPGRALIATGPVDDVTAVGDACPLLAAAKRAFAAATCGVAADGAAAVTAPVADPAVAPDPLETPDGEEAGAGLLAGLMPLAALLVLPKFVAKSASAEDMLCTALKS